MFCVPYAFFAALVSVLDTSLNAAGEAMDQAPVVVRDEAIRLCFGSQLVPVTDAEGAELRTGTGGGLYPSIKLVYTGDVEGEGKEGETEQDDKVRYTRYGHPSIA